MQLPVLSLGLWHNFGSVDDFSVATQMVVRAFDAGICHFDRMTKAEAELLGETK